MYLKNNILLFLLACSFTVFSSCSNHGGKHQYYILSPSGPASQVKGLAIGVGPVITSKYLDRPYLVFQTSDNTLDVNEGHEWAGALEDEFVRVLGTNIGRNVNSGNIQTYPWFKGSDLDYQVAIDLKRFHGTNTGDALLEASWRIYKLPGSRQIVSKSITLTEPLEADGFDSLVEAQSKLIERLSVKIASSLH